MSSHGLATILEGVGNSGPKFDAGRVFLALSDALVPLFVAFAFLAVAWLLVAVGLRRQQ